MGSSHRGHGIGLSDIRRRLELLYGEAYRLDTFVNELGGFSVQLFIPAVESRHESRVNGRISRTCPVARRDEATPEFATA